MLRSVRQRVHMRLAREVVGRGCKTAIGTLAQRRLGGMKLDELIGDVVRRTDGGGAGVVVVVLPGDERAVLLDARADLDEAGGAQVGPGEFILARPDNFDGLAGGFCQARGFDGRFAGVLAAIAAAHVGLDDAHLRRREMEGCISSSRTPKGRWVPVHTVSLPLGPFGDGGAGFERRVGDVFDSVAFLELDVGGGHGVGDRSGDVLR